MNNEIYYFLCIILIIGILAGIAMMSKVNTAVKGNILSSVCTVAAILITLYKYEIFSSLALWICLVVSTIIGLIAAYAVKMIEMPQAVALLNGFGGAASALVAAITMLDNYHIDVFSKLTAALALATGVITLIGSLVAAGKLHKLLSQRPVIWQNHKIITALSLILTVVSVIIIGAVPPQRGIPIALVLICAILSGFFGAAFAIRVGGADMPITISLLNSLSGVAGSIAGMAISDPLLVAVGGIVGASGLLLTQIMCRAMNRSLSDILLGKTSAATSKASASKEQPIVNIAPPLEEKKEENAVDILKDAKKIIIVPGYGMALSQAQGLVKELSDKLEEKGAEVLFAIHPVAGRMPGHMNVLLCEADVPYEKLYEMEDINPQFAECDAAIVIGANDVINPAANTAEDTPIYGMPILSVSDAKHIIICNYDLKPGYAGVENPLYHKAEGVTLLLGDAKVSIKTLIEKLL